MIHSSQKVSGGYVGVTYEFDEINGRIEILRHGWRVHPTSDAAVREMKCNLIPEFPWTHERLLNVAIPYAEAT